MVLSNDTICALAPDSAPVNISPIANHALSDSMKTRFDRIIKELRRIPGSSISVNNRAIVFSEDTFKVI